MNKHSLKYFKGHPPQFNDGLHLKPPVKRKQSKEMERRTKVFVKDRNYTYMKVNGNNENYYLLPNKIFKYFGYVLAEMSFTNIKISSKQFWKILVFSSNCQEILFKTCQLKPLTSKIPASVKFKTKKIIFNSRYDAYIWF